MLMIRCWGWMAGYMLGRRVYRERGEAGAEVEQSGTESFCFSPGLEEAKLATASP